MKTTAITFAELAAVGLPTFACAAVLAPAGIGNPQVMWPSAARVRGTDAAHKPGDPPRTTLGV